MGSLPAAELIDRLPGPMKSAVRGVRHARDVGRHVYGMVTGPDDEAVWIVGHPRSGTTAIAQLLSDHTGLPVAREVRWASQHSRDLKAGRMTLDAFFRKYGYPFSRPLVQTPGLTPILPMFVERLPALRLVYIVRDPRDVICSVIAVSNRNNTNDFVIHNPDFTAFDNAWLGIDEDDPVRSVARRWMLCLEVAQSLPNVSFYRYEDFCAGKSRFIHELADDLGLPHRRDIDKRVDVQHRPNQGKIQGMDRWKKMLPATAVDDIERICALGMRQYGYRRRSLLETSRASTSPESEVNDTERWSLAELCNDHELLSGITHVQRVSHSLDMPQVPPARVLARLEQEGITKPGELRFSESFTPRHAYACYEWYRQNVNPDRWGRYLERCLGDVVRGARVLDVGCGAGATMAWCLERGAAQVTGIDVDEPYLELARELVGADPRVKLHLGDAHHLPFDDESFDIVICRVTLVYVQHEQVLAEIARVLVPTGLFYLQVQRFWYYFKMLVRPQGRRLRYGTRALLRGIPLALLGQRIRPGEVFLTSRQLRRDCERVEMQLVSEWIGEPLDNLRGALYQRR